MEYHVVKAQVLPRVCKILETASQIELKLEVLDTLTQILNAIDTLYLKNDIMKALEKFRAKETDPKICMKMLVLYEQIGKQLGPEEVGNKVLPGIIPMLITGNFTKQEFKDIMDAVRRLLTQIEDFRSPTLPDTNPHANMFQTEAKKDTSNNSSDPLAFLNTGNTPAKASTSNAAIVDDIFAGINNSSSAASTKPTADPFSNAFGNINMGGDNMKKANNN